MNTNPGTVYKTVINGVDGLVDSDGPITQTATQSCWPERRDYMQSLTKTTKKHSVQAKCPNAEERTYVPFSATQSRSPYDRNQSFKQIQASGLIKMTNYRHHKDKVENFLVYENKELASRYQYVAIHNWISESSPRAACEVNTHYKNLESIARWQEGGDLQYWKDHYPTAAHYTAPEVDLSRDINALMSKVVSDNFKTYDMMTDLYELRSTLKTIAGLLSKVRRPLQSFRDAREVLKSKGATHQAITKLWMQYRYGIMPIMYAIEDASKLADQLIDKYMTSRGSRTIDLYFNGKPSFSPDKVTFFDIVEGETKLRAVGKARYITSVQRLLDQTSFNVASGLWEIIPYSLVVDWFSNTGEWLHVHTSNLADFASQRAFCMSSKTTKTVSTYVRIVTDDTPGFNQPARVLGKLGSNHIPEWVVPKRQGSADVFLLRRTTSEHYDRWLFSPNDVEWTLDAQFSNWKRWADGYVMSLKPILYALRKLR